MLSIPTDNTNVVLGYKNLENSHQVSTAIGLQGSFGNGSAIAADVLAALSLTNVGPDLAPSWELTSIAIEDDASRTVFDVSSPGSGPSNPPPSNVSILMHKATSLRGRKNSGRMYWPSGYIDEGNIDGGGNIASLTVADLQTQFQSYLLPLLDIDGVDIFVLFHTDPADSPTEIVGLTVESMVATQRRRLR